MAYTKTNWKDRAVQYPRRYRDQNGNIVTLTPEPGTVYEPGTPVNAPNLNKIEQGIDYLDKNAFLPHGNLTGAVDFNTVMEIGAYRLFDGPFSNGPNGDLRYSILEVIPVPESSLYLTQRLTRTGVNTTVWIRTWTQANGWYPWVTLWNSSNFDPNTKADQTSLTNHANATSAHGAVSTATPNRIPIRDAAGNFFVSAPTDGWHVARKAEVDTAETNAKNASLPRTGGTLTGDTIVTKEAARFAVRAVSDTSSGAIGYAFQGAGGAYRYLIRYQPNTGVFSIFDYGLNRNRLTMNPDGPVLIDNNEAWTAGNTPQTRLNNGVFEVNNGGWKPVGGIKRVQRGEVTTVSGTNPYNITISAVDMAKSFVTFNNTISLSSESINVKARLTSSTNLQISMNQTVLGAGYGFTWEVVESY